MARCIEPLFALLIVAGLINALWSLRVNGYLPQPFFFNASDNWMDWSNTAYWAHNTGAYDVWYTLYPPISFLFLRITTLARCYPAAEAYTTYGFAGRDCDWLAMLVMHGWFVLNVFLVGKTFLKIDRSTALYRTIAVAAGMPMLDALERGNLIMVTFSCFILAHGPLLRSARWRWIMIAVTINMKVYLIPTLFAYLLRRRWRWFEGAAIAMILIYVITWGLLGVGTPVEIYRSLSSWSDPGPSTATWLDAWYGVTYGGVLALLQSNIFPIISVVGSARVEFFETLIQVFVHSAQLGILVAVVAVWLRPEVVSMPRIVNLCGLLAMITTEPGGYVMALIAFLTFFERWESGVGCKVAIVMSYILAIPAEIYIDPFMPLPNPGFMNKGTIFYAYWIAYGPFVRPAMVLITTLALSSATIADVYADIRAQGWKSRRRYRNDLPLMMNGGGTRWHRTSEIR